MQQGIILRSTPYKDFDLIVCLLTESHGKLSAYLRSARKSKGPACEIFDCGRFELKLNHRGLSRISGFIPTSSFPKLRSNLCALSVATFVCEAFDYLVPEYDDVDSLQMYQLLKGTFEQLSSHTENKLLLRTGFNTVYSLLRNSGFLPPDQNLQASAKNLFYLTRLIEQHSERKLKSTDLIHSMIQDLRTQIAV